MAVISLTIIDSPVQIVQGVPKNISVTTSLPSTVFFTLDGSIPTVNSEIVVGPIPLPTIYPTVIFKAFATDGTTTSAIITQTYQNLSFAKLRNSRDKVIGANNNTSNLGIFSSNSPNLNVSYDGAAGEIVDAPGIVGIPDGYDGTATGTAASQTDLPLTSYQFTYSLTDRIGQTGRGIGTLPATVKIIVPPQLSDISYTSKKLFNPKALLIIQDGTKPPDDPNISLINRPLFSLKNPNTSDGVDYTRSGLEGATATGSFVRQHYNPRDQTITYYYYDNAALRWIISKEPYVAKYDNLYNYSNMILPSRDPGAKFVYQWGLFRRRVLT